jgi:hypothetical protein
MGWTAVSLSCSHMHVTRESAAASARGRSCRLISALLVCWFAEASAAATRTFTLNGLEIGLDEINGGIV